MTATETAAIQPVLRLDAPHRLGAAPPSERVSGGESVTVAADSDVAHEQLQVQAGQLARHLQDRRRDIDYRESQVNARIAQLENDLRVSRLWQREQSREFSQCEAELREQLAQYEARAAALVMAETAIEEARMQQDESAKLRDDELARRERRIDETHRQILSETQRLTAAREQLDADRRRWEHERSEAARTQARQELDALHREHQATVARWESEQKGIRDGWEARQAALAEQGRAFEVERRRWHEHREQQAASLDAHRRELDERQVAIERSRAEVVARHQEVLESQWTADHLWSQLVERIPADELAARSARLRGQLADEFQFAREELEQRETRIQELLERLEAKQTALVDQRRELTAWFGRQQRRAA